MYPSQLWVGMAGEKVRTGFLGVLEHRVYIFCLFGFRFLYPWAFTPLFKVAYDKNEKAITIGVQNRVKKRKVPFHPWLVFKACLFYLHLLTLQNLNRYGLPACINMLRNAHGKGVRMELSRLL